MKKISKATYDACAYFEKNSKKSMTQIGKMFNTDRHGISRYLSNYKDYIYYKDGYYYRLDSKELEAIESYLNNQKITLKDIENKYNIDSKTIQKGIAIIGKEYERHYYRNFNRQAFKEIKTEEDAYWLGFILADGYINEDKYFLNIKLAKKDEKHLEKFANYMQEKDFTIKHDIGGAYTRDNICSYITYTSQSLINNLNQYGLHQRKSGKEKPIQFNDPSLKIAYIRGMVDGDGHIKDKEFKYVGSLDSCQYIKNFCSQYCSLKQEYKYIYNNDTIFSFEIHGKNANKIIKMLYNNANIYLDRKYIIAQNIKI